MADSNGLNILGKFTPTGWRRLLAILSFSGYLSVANLWGREITLHEHLTAVVVYACYFGFDGLGKWAKSRNSNGSS